MKRGEIPRSAPMRSRYRSTGPTHQVVDACLERSSFSCELCTAGIGPRRGEDYEVHHRRARRSGGSRLPDTNSPVNLLILCCDCHSTVERERTAAYEGGWLVRQNDSPAIVPVLIGATRWVLLTADGQYAPGYREVQP
jgi:hypothetical protein